MHLRHGIEASAALFAVVVAACTAQPSGGGESIAPTPSVSASALSGQSAAPTRSPSEPVAPPSVVVSGVTSRAQAAALVFASNPIFSSITPTNLGAVGQSEAYSVSDSGDGFAVSVTMGSGDCPAGCINEHTWDYSVGRDGKVSLVSEHGDEVEVSVDHGTADPATVTIRLIAGPVCPVERIPPDPSCAPRPVPDIQVVLRDPSGAQVATGVADASGEVVFSVPGGAYYAEPADVPSLMGQALPAAFSVPGGRSATITLEYDTGIR